MEDASPIATLLQNLQSPENTLRSAAETQIKTHRTSNPQQLLEELLNTVQTNNAANQGVQQLAALLLKKFYLDKRPEEEGLWQLGLQEHTALKDALLKSIDFTQPMSLLKKKAEIICACYREIQNFPELITQLVSVLQSQEGTPQEIAMRKEYAMYIFELLAEYHLPQEQIVQNSAQFMQLFTDCLKDSNISVKVASLKAITSFLGSIDDETAVLKYQDMMDWILDVVIDVLRSDEDKGKASIESLIELTQTHGEIWSKSIPKLVFVVSQIVQNKSFEDSTRQSSLEIISQIAESIPQLLRKSQADLKTHLFPALAHMLAQPLYEDNLEEWSNYVEEEIQARNDPASVAADNINRIASFIGEKTIINCTTHIIKEAIESKDNWHLRQAGYLFLGMISDTCAPSFKKNMDEIMRMSASGLMDPHPRVRYEAMTCLGLLLTELAPDAQQKYHDQLISVLLKLMQEEQILKIRTQATSCMVNFVRGLISEDGYEDVEDDKQKEYSLILAPYSTSLVETISQLFQISLDKNYAPLQEEVLGLLSCLANVLESKFAEHYNRFMPGLKKILYDMPMNTSQEQELRAHCIQTIGFILTALKDQPELCKQDALEVAQNLTTLLNSGKVTDADAQILAIQNTLSQIGSCIKQEFRQFLPHIMPALLKDAARDIDLKIQDAELPGGAGDKEGVTALKVKVKGLEGERQISMNTNALENKINAIQIIKNLAQSLGSGFFEQVEPVAQLIVKELLDYQYSKAVRKAATQTLVFLMNGCQDSNQMKALFAFVYPSLKARIENRMSKFDFSELRFLMREFQKCVKQFWNFGKMGDTFLPLAEAHALVQLIGEVAKFVRDDRHTRLEQFKTASKKMDEEDVEYFEEDIKKIDKIENRTTLTQQYLDVMEIAGVMVHVYKEQVSSGFIQYLLPHFGQTLFNMQGGRDYEIRILFNIMLLVNAVCFFCDVLEYGGNDLFSMSAGKAADKFMQCIQAFAEDRGLLQSCAYGLGAIAKRYPQGQFPQLQQTVQLLTKIIAEPDSRTDDDKAESTDNVIGALGKCVLFQFDNQAVTMDIVKEYLSLMPLYTDSEEAQSVHKLFFEQVLAKNQVLMQPELANDVKATVMRVVKIAQDRPHLELLDDEGKQKAEQIIALM